MRPREGRTVIFSTHDVNFAYEFADYIYIVKDGKIVKEGNKKEVFNSMEEIKKYNLDFPEIGVPSGKCGFTTLRKFS